jgi:hypothetical protein
MRIIVLTIAVSGFGGPPIVLFTQTPPLAGNIASARETPCGPGPVYRPGQRGVRQATPVTKLEPKYPDATGHMVDGGVFLFEAVITRDGAVCEVRMIRSVKFTPPLPQYAEALRQAIAQSKYKPAIDQRSLRRTIQNSLWGRTRVSAPGVRDAEMKPWFGSHVGNELRFSAGCWLACRSSPCGRSAAVKAAASCSARRTLRNS